MRPRLEPAGLVALGLLTLVWAWWGVKEGAFFEVVLLPGIIVLCLGGALLACFAPWRADLSLSRSARLGLWALIALGGWAALSAFWSPAPDIALVDAQRIFVYAISFGLGIWLCNLLGPRMELALLPLVAAAAVAAVVATAMLGSSDAPRDLLEYDGTLDYPLGYRNANAAFFAIALFPAVGAAAAARLDWRLRAVGLATATICLDLFLLCQSRGSVIAMTVGVVFFVLLAPSRIRALAWLALAALPAIGVIGPLTELYSAVNDEGMRNAVDEMHSAAGAVAITGLIALVAGALGARFESSLPGLGSNSDAANRNVGRAFAALAAIAAVAFVAAVGNPVSWIGDRIDEFDEGTPDLSQRDSRFSINAGSSRYDLWRVALDDFSADPLRGDGGGGFQYTYLRERDGDQREAKDAHSVELEVLSELGLPGLVLLLAGLGGAAVAASRSRRLGPSAAGLSAIALASGSYWLAHSSIDWFWAYPVVTAPVLALLGSAAAPTLLTLEPRRELWWRPWLVTGLIALALSAVPFWLSERYVDNASAIWREDPERAFDELALAQDLNPLSDWPILVEGEIAMRLGETEQAIDAFGRAVEERPEEFAGYFRLAQLLAPRDEKLAQEQARVALELNPQDPLVRQLARRLGIEAAAEPASAG